MKSPNTKSTSEIKSEVRQELKNLNRDINAIEDRLTPGQFIDDAIFHGRGRSFGATVDHLKNNPIGTAFLSLGTILLMEDEKHQTMETLSKNKMTSVKDSIRSVKETVKNQLPHKELTTGTSPSIGDIAKGKLTGLKDSITNMDPMAYMALGLGLGALTGASLPISEQEKTFVHEKMSSKLGDLNSDLQNALNECSNILKDLVISDVKNFNIQLFKT